MEEKFIIPCPDGKCDPRSNDPNQERFLTCTKCGKIVENSERNKSHLGFS